jgi:O-antigen ligase
MTIIFFFLAAVATTALGYVLILVDPYFLLDPTDRYWLTLNGRTDVWSAAAKMFEMAPIIGWGFFLGPKHIGDIINQPWWHATNAQSDLLGAMVCGGYTGLILYLGFILVMLFEVVRIKERKRRFVMFGVVLLYAMSSSFEPFFVHNLGVATVVMLALLMQSRQWGKSLPQVAPSFPVVRGRARSP